MDLSLKPEEIQFRDQVRAFLAAKLPAEIAHKVKHGHGVGLEDNLHWGRILNEKGWIAPNWPAQYGGLGWSLIERHIFDMECRRAHTPPVHGFNFTMIGPALIAYGNEEQKAHYLPRILSMEDLWCQGYSEPGAGSDLASLQTRAVKDGNDYVVNGAKIWTSAAEIANRIFCLVRTDMEAKPQAGISFLLIDMASPGIEVKPLIALNGVRLWNEVFFTDVRVPVANRLGAENRGWSVAKKLLGDERVMVSRVAENTRLLAKLKEIAGLERADGARLIDEAGFGARIAALETRLLALENSSLRLLAIADKGGVLGAEPSMLKLLGSELVQAIDVAMVDAVAYYAVPDSRHLAADKWNEPPIGAEHAAMVSSNMLHHLGFTIAGGTSEVQRGVIAKQVLGL